MATSGEPVPEESPQCDSILRELNAESSVRQRSPKVRLMIGAALVLAIATVTWLWGDRLELSELAEREAQWRVYGADHPLLVAGLAILLYVAVTSLMLPGATALTLAYAWYFGFWRALLLVSFASTAGATVAFLLSRYLLRDAVAARFGDRLRSFNQALEKEGAYYLLTLRLIPLVPFFVINTVMGLTPMRTRTFWWVSQLGMLPGTAVYVYAGASVPSLQVFAEQGTRGLLSPQLIAALTLLGLMPLATKRLLRLIRR